MITSVQDEVSKTSDPLVGDEVWTTSDPSVGDGVLTTPDPSVGGDEGLKSLGRSSTKDTSEEVQVNLLRKLQLRSASKIDHLCYCDQ